MKIIYFTTYYTPYLEQFYRIHPEVAEMGYEEQMKAILYDSYGWGNYIELANKAGAEAHLIIVNCKQLQRKWAEENNVAFNESDYMFSISMAQIKKIRPDVFFISSMFEYYGKFLSEVRKYCKNIFGWISCPIPDRIDLKQIDLLLSSLPSYVSMFRNRGINSEVLSAFFDSSILPKLEKLNNAPIDFSFIGGFSAAHSKRIELLSGLAKATGIQIFGYGIDKVDQRSGIVKKIFPHPLVRKYKGEVWGLEMYNTLRRSKISFNSHIDIAGDYGVNMRMYEATGVGSLLLSDRKKNEIFIEDKEIVLYSNLQEAIEKVKYYLSHEAERKQIALAGQKKTLDNFNSTKIIESMLFYFKKYLK